MRHRLHLAAILAAFLLPGSALGQGNGLVSPELHQALQDCIVLARDEGADLGRCRGGVTQMCLEAKADGAVAGQNRLSCLQTEAFAWDETCHVVVTDYLKRMDGRAGFSRDDFVSELDARLAELREACLRFQPGQEDKVVDCTLDRSIEMVRWVYRLLDESEG